MGHFQDVEAAWALSDKALDFVHRAGAPVTVAQVFEQVFAASPLVDLPRTRAEGGPYRIFLTSAYGLQWRAQFRDWVPFRHGPVDLENI